MEQRTRIGVYGATTGSDRVLLTRLASHAPGAGRWTLPGGGMEFGESPHETLVREFHEETGLEPEICGVLDVISFLPRPGFHVIQMIYEVKAHGAPRVMEVDGSTVEARWVPVESVRTLPSVSLVDHLAELRGW